MSSPESLPKLTTGLLLGRSIPSTVGIINRFKVNDSAPTLPTRIGVERESTPDRSPRPEMTDITYNGEGHLITIAPTGSGKGLSAVIPNLLTYPGSVVVIDPKGENFAVTSRRRKAMGHQVIRLDPFHVMGADSDSLNPLDLFDLRVDFDDTNAEMISELLSVGNVSGKDPFWDNSAQGLISALVNIVACPKSPFPKSLNSVRNLLCSTNLDSDLLSVVDAIEGLPQSAIQEADAYVAIRGAEITQKGILATAKSYFRSLMSESVEATLENSTFELSDFVLGKKLSIYLIIPPHKLSSHRALLRLWIGTLLHAVTNRRHLVNSKTLFILDECGQLGHLSHLETLVTLCRGYGVHVWMFWQDVSQLSKLYTDGWKTMLNNCDVIQLFGAKNFMVAQEFASISGMSATEMQGITPAEQVLILSSSIASKSHRVNYLLDHRFNGLHDRNPLHERTNDSPPKNTRSAFFSIHDSAVKSHVAALEQDIRLRAYLKWEAGGRRVGTSEQHWLEAEEEVLASKASSINGASEDKANFPDSRSV